MIPGLYTTTVGMINQQNMRKIVPKNNEEDSFSQEVYTSMMDEEFAKAVSRGSGIGFAEVLYRQFTVKKN